MYYHCRDTIESHIKQNRIQTSKVLYSQLKMVKTPGFLIIICNCSHLKLCSLTSSAAVLQFSLHKTMMKNVDCRVTQMRSPSHSPVTENTNHSDFLQTKTSALQCSVLTYDAHFGCKHQGQSDGNADAVISHQVTDGPDPLLPRSS